LYIVLPFHGELKFLIPARDRQTDGRMDGQTRCDHYYPR